MLKVFGMMVFLFRRSFHSFEQLSAEVSLNSDSQKNDGRQNGDAAWTSAGKYTCHCFCILCK